MSSFVINFANQVLSCPHLLNSLRFNHRQKTQPASFFLTAYVEWWNIHLLTRKKTTSYDFIEFCYWNKAHAILKQHPLVPHWSISYLQFRSIVLGFHLKACGAPVEIHESYIAAQIVFDVLPSLLPPQSSVESFLVTLLLLVWIKLVLSWCLILLQIHLLPRVPRRLSILMLQRDYNWCAEV